MSAAVRPFDQCFIILLEARAREFKVVASIERS